MKKSNILTTAALLLAALAMPACDDDDNDGVRDITNANTVSPQPGTSEGFVKGADVSWLTQMEAKGYKFYSASGVETECLTLLKSLGVEAVRLRVFVNPSNGYNDKADLTAMALRASQLGMSVMVDFHYSDVWADPENQDKPEAWADLSFDELRQAVADHTTDILTALKEKGVTPAWVQIGNEVGDGLLWPDGRASVNPDRFAKLLNAGIGAARDACPDVKTIVHVQNGWNQSTCTWIASILQKYEVDYDILGVSLYPAAAVNESSTLTTAAAAVSLTISNLELIARQYGKETMVCEFGYPASDPDGGYDCLKALVDNGKESAYISGVFYWEPESYDWYDYELGAFTNEGKPSHTLDAFAG